MKLEIYKRYRLIVFGVVVVVDFRVIMSFFRIWGKRMLNKVLIYCSYYVSGMWCSREIDR